jgi:hypothetical protein
MGRIKKEALDENSLKRKILEVMNLKSFAKLAGVRPSELSFYLNKNRRLKRNVTKNIKAQLIKFNFILKPLQKQYRICKHCGSKVRILNK